MTFFVHDRTGKRIGSIEVSAPTLAEAQHAANSYAERFKAGAVARLVNTATAAKSCERCCCPSTEAECCKCRLGRVED